MKYKNFYILPECSESRYFGKITGEKELGIIESDSMDGLTREFQKTVDDYLEEKKVRCERKRKRVVISILTFIAIIISMTATCPTKDKHISAFSNQLTAILNDSADADETGLAVIGVLFGNQIIDALVGHYLVIDDCLIFNVGKLHYGGKAHIVSIGAFGHVFTIPQKQLEEAVHNNKDLQELMGGLT